MYLMSSLMLFTPITLLNIYNQNIGFAIKNMFYISVSFCLKYFLNTEVFINSNRAALDLINENRQVIIIQNHFSEIDYMFVSYFLTNFKNFYQVFRYKMIFVAKKLVGNIFIGLGIFSLLSKDLYLNRDIKSDYTKISSNNNANLLYIFPEGTCFNSFTKKISDKFTKKNKLIKFKYHLYPRTTGIHTIMKSNPKYNIVYDFTVMFDTVDKKDLYQIHKFHDFVFKYDFPSRVFININKYNLNLGDHFNQRLEHIYYKKDNFIKKFDVNQNKFKKINYHFEMGLTCFIFSNFITIISLFLYFKYDFFRTLYFFEILLYLIYFNFLQ